jgi:L-amino acid N-acyltransferase YncA
MVSTGFEAAGLSSARVIRMARVSDAAAIAEIYAPHVTDSPASFELVPPDAHEMAQRMKKVLERTPWLVTEEYGRVLGYAYGSKHREREAYQWSIEVSAYVRTDVQRGGVARGLYEKLFQILVRQGFYSAFAGITLPNPASVGFHEALGFRKIGVFHKIGFKFGEWHDTGWYERALQPYAAPSTPPIPITDPAMQQQIAQILQ